MMRYLVVWTVSKDEETDIVAGSIDEAKVKWEALGCEGELFFIEDENGTRTFFE